ncbi:hypothetical protein LIER_37496 [Lithospermum erythrorhizon]|uniref:Integrase catalytic domain-containing protein n=1 Tax=Lithospermum erythrorhizon TaxID=34254 RepID=A0AAV3PMH0_LITER
MPGGEKYTIVGVDYFTKWVEAKPLTRQDHEGVYQFLKEIFTRFKVPQVLIMGNETQFTAESVEDLYWELDALLLVEIRLETARVSYYNDLANEHGLLLNLDLLEEKRDVEGPYLVKRIVGPDLYELETFKGRQVSRSWNVCHLRKYYI